jgi:hypothetical protein
MNSIFRQQIKADADHMIHVHLPPDMGDDVEVIVFSRQAPKSATPQTSQEMAQLFDETGFANKVLNSLEEDCWNDL